MAELDQRAAEMFAAGKSVTAVADALYKRWYKKAKEQKELWLAATGAAPAPERKSKPRKKPGRPRAVEPEAEEVAGDVPESFDFSVTVGTASLERVFATFTAQEQANAVAGVIQMRMDALLEGE